MGNIGNNEQQLQTKGQNKEIPTIPTAIIVGDIQWRDDQPRCRTDDFWQVQVDKAELLHNLWVGFDCPPVLQVGDLFERWKSSPRVISAVIQHLPPMDVIPGNHDLPAHNLDDYERSALRVLDYVEHWHTHKDEGFHIFGADISIMPWGITKPILPLSDTKTKKLLLAHIMVVERHTDYLDGVLATEMLDQYPEYDLIVVGHNHHPFLISSEDGKRFVLNPGSFTRQTVTEDHEPSVWLWWAEGNRLEQVVIPHKPYGEVISKHHLEEKKEKDGRIAEYVEKLKEAGGQIVNGNNGVVAAPSPLSFTAGLEQALLDPEIGDEVKKRCWWAVDKEKDK